MTETHEQFQARRMKAEPGWKKRDRRLAYQHRQKRLALEKIGSLVVRVDDEPWVLPELRQRIDQFKAKAVKQVAENG